MPKPKPPRHLSTLPTVCHYLAQDKQRRRVGTTLLLAKQWQYVCKCVLSERCKSFSSRRSPACSRPELRRREAGWEVPGGERPVRNESELDSAGCFGEPAANWRSPDRKRKLVTLRGSVLKRWRGTPGGWRWNGRKAEHMTQRDLSGTRLGRAGVRGVIVARKPGNAGGAKGSRKMDDE